MKLSRVHGNRRTLAEGGIGRPAPRIVRLSATLRLGASPAYAQQKHAIRKALSQAAELRLHPPASGVSPCATTAARGRPPCRWPAQSRPMHSVDPSGTVETEAMVPSKVLPFTTRAFVIRPELDPLVD